VISRSALRRRFRCHTDVKNDRPRRTINEYV